MAAEPSPSPQPSPPLASPSPFFSPSARPSATPPSPAAQPLAPLGPDLGAGLLTLRLGSFLALALLAAALALLERRGFPVLATLRRMLAVCGCLRRATIVALSAAADASTTAAASAASAASLSASAAVPSAESDERVSMSASSASLSALVAAGGGGQGWEDRRGASLVGLGPGEQALLAASEVRALTSHLPSRCVGRDWHCVFSTARDGYALSTLWSCVRGKGPTVVVIMDDQQRVFGAFASRDWSGSDPSSGSYGFAAAHGLADSPAGKGGRGAYFGSGESFLFTARPQFGVHRWTRKNTLFMLARPDCLAMGGGGSKFGLWLDSNLERGSSGSCDTFANPPLASSEIFKVVSVQCYSFVLPLPTASVIAGSIRASASGLFLSLSGAARPSPR